MVKVLLGIGIGLAASSTPVGGSVFVLSLANLISGALG
jgi:hypothetical protein